VELSRSVQKIEKNKKSDDEVDYFPCLFTYNYSLSHHLFMYKYNVDAMISSQTCSASRHWM